MSKWPNDLKYADVTFAEHPLHLFNADILVDAIIESADLSPAAKRDFVDWLFKLKKFDDRQHTLAVARINHIEKKKSQSAAKG